MTADLQAFFSRKGKILIQSRRYSDQPQTAKNQHLEWHEQHAELDCTKKPLPSRISCARAGAFFTCSHFEVLQDTLYLFFDQLKRGRDVRIYFLAGKEIKGCL